MGEKKSKGVKLSNTEIYSDSVLTAALTMNRIHNQKLDVDVLIGEICKKTRRIVVEGNIREIEIMLATQAQTLNFLFHRLITFAMDTGSLDQIRGLTEIGLRSQKQCRQTLLALAELKHPQRATFIKQQNVAVNQQVNNANQGQNLENSENSANELLKGDAYETLDEGRTPKAIAVDSRVETVEPRKRGDNA